VVAATGDLMDFLVDVVHWFTTASNWRGTGGIPHRVSEHVVMSGAAVATAVIIALPVGLVLGHLRRGGVVAVNLANVGRAVPSFALLVLAYFVFGLGPKPPYVALVALAIPPIVTNAYVGMADVDDDIREVAAGMGMTGGQTLRRVELPLALPLVMAGIRTAGVQVVATATLAAVIGWGGLGRYIIDGFGQQDHVKIFAGALLVAVLAIVVELGLAAVQRLTLSPGISGRRSPVAPLSGLPGAAAGHPNVSLSPAVLNEREEQTHADAP
jgi:osmoprotectant transport system permease protein